MDEWVGLGKGAARETNGRFYFLTQMAFPLNNQPAAVEANEKKEKETSLAR